MGNSADKVFTVLGDTLRILLDDRDKHSVEFDIFIKSFVLIERHLNEPKGLTKRFVKEYDSTDGHYLDWHKVMGRCLRPKNKGMGYVEAIEMTARLLKKAKDYSHSSDKSTFDDIRRSVIQLIVFREEELDPKFNILGWVPEGMGGRQYDSHKYVIDAWNRFMKTVFK